jgi:hypothetical protein
MTQCVMISIIFIILWLAVVMWAFAPKKLQGSAWTNPVCQNECSKYNPSKHFAQYQQCIDKCGEYEQCINHCDVSCRSPSCDTQQCYMGCGSA